MGNKLTFCIPVWREWTIYTMIKIHCPNSSLKKRTLIVPQAYYMLRFDKKYTPKVTEILFLFTFTMNSNNFRNHFEKISQPQLSGQY